MKKVLTIIFFIFLFEEGLTQRFCSEISLKNDTIQLDTNISVIPSTIKIFCNNQKIDIQFINAKNIIVLKDSCKQVKLCFDYVKKQYSYLDTAVILSKNENSSKKISYDYENENFSYENSRYEPQTNGIISKSISAGSNQDIVFNSKLNLEINGNLNENYKINAKIIDNNIPIQPDGTTTTITDFGKVYIKVYDTNKTYFIGDYQLKNAFGYFSKFQKELKTLFFRTKDSSKFFKIGTSLTKGIYQKQKITPIEGSQGPYKLIGKNNENFILVIANSERVFVDGKLKKRGLENDYIIDYNKAEITFMPGCPITKDSRIIVEFQYSQKFYTNYFNFVEYYKKTDSLELGFSHYIQKDNENNPIFQFTTDEISYLKQIGDSSKILYPYQKKIENPSSNQILYKKKDTLVNGKKFTIFEYCTDTTGELFEVKFSYVGKNKGNYVIAENTINGRIYKWVAPQNGISQGDYEVGITLIAPQRHSISTFFIKYKLHKFNISSQTTFSNYDANTFSSLYEENNKGFAQRIILENKNSGNHFFVEGQFINKNFTPFENFRDIEFARNWNYFFQNPDNEIFSQVSFKHKFNDSSFFIVNPAILVNEANYLGVKNNFSNKFENNFFEIKVGSSFLNSFEKAKKTFFLTNDFGLYKKFNKIKIGLIFQNETNKIYERDTLNFRSFKWLSGGFSIISKDSTMEAKYVRRFDYLPQNDFILSYTSDNLFFNFNKKITNSLSISNKFFYRNLKNNLTNEKSENNLGVSNFFKIQKKGFLLSINQLHQQGKQAKKEYVFVEVEPTKGQYQWIDYNRNGIKEINEFEIAKFPEDAKYIRLEMQTNQYVSVFQNKINFSNQIAPKYLLPQVFFLQNFKNSLSFNLLINSNEFNFFGSQPAEKNYQFSENISFQKKNFKADYFFKNSSNLQAFIYDTIGNDQRSNQLIFSVLKSNFEISIFFEKGKTVSSSKAFSENNFEFQTRQIGNQVIFKAIKFSLTTTYTEKISLQNLSNLYQFKIIGTNEFSIKKINFKSQIQFINNNYSGNLNTPLAYRLLEGYSEGKNLIAELMISKKIFKNFQGSLNFQIRQNPQKTIFYGNVNFSLVF